MNIRLALKTVAVRRGYCVLQGIKVVSSRRAKINGKMNLDVC